MVMICGGLLLFSCHNWMKKAASSLMFLWVAGNGIKVVPRLI